MDTYQFTNTIWSQTPNNELADIELGDRPADSNIDPNDGGIYTVASFHTHPPRYYLTEEDMGGLPSPTGPSSADHEADQLQDVAGLVYDYTADWVSWGHPLNSEAMIYTTNHLQRVKP